MSEEWFGEALPNGVTVHPGYRGGLRAVGAPVPPLLIPSSLGDLCAFG
ncbi:MAG: hypothetical protein SNJ67_08935 [Chloracidobacterium sp.]|uniref:Uncharacterized protein n=1 Tax=Chloracidobacterium validum TaxID=2821543 RepID=A0ABX8B8G3_9BACT|nr:hypothetical protein [Chloracidobacterium validum]QUW02346.1 hypothetical protein J8C06_08250 [Chloracidobacterium validum]